MLFVNSEIKKCKKHLEELMIRYTKLEMDLEDNPSNALIKSEIDSLLLEIDCFKKDEYAKMIFEVYSKKKPLLVHRYNGSVIKWEDAFGLDYKKVPDNLIDSLIGLIEDDGKYKFK